MLFEWVRILGYLGDFLQAALLVLEVTALAFALAMALGVVAALGRGSRVWILRFVAGIYIEAIRNTPLLLQVFVAYFALPSIGLRIDAFTAGVIAVGVNIGAYLAEVFRAGFSSVPKGQREAAGTLGLSPARTFVHVVFPQAVRNVYPAIINNLLQVLLGTSILSAIALPELSGTAIVLNARTLLFVQVFTVTLVIYLVLTNLLILVGSVIGRLVFKPSIPLRRGALVRLALPRRSVAPEKVTR